MKRVGPCLCGDTQCPSCGPAQGNVRCPVCGEWSEDGGCADPRWCEKQGKEMDEAMYRNHLIDKLLVKKANEQGVAVMELDIPWSSWKGWEEMPLKELEGLSKVNSVKKRKN